VRINLEHDVAAKGVTSGFERYRFANCALPEIDLSDVDTGCTLLGRRLRAPVVISCMTGGTPQAREINNTLARVAQEHGLAMGLGSGRALLERDDLLDTFAVREQAPDVLLFANLGAVQLNKGYGTAECARLVELLQADALVLHLNAIQEALQPEGDTCFRGLLRKIDRLCRELAFPVVVKEVGWGIAADTVCALFNAGVAAVDLAGAGGTSWSEVERYRIEQAWRANAAAAFAAWGIPAAEALRDARAACPSGTLIASGGIRAGLDVVKALAMGADAVGIAGEFLRAAAKGYDAADALARELREVLHIAMFALGERTIADLRCTERLIDDRAR
jgi:isopentenyl-diphosphate delta-isomerase